MFLFFREINLIFISNSRYLFSPFYCGITPSAILIFLFCVMPAFLSLWVLTTALCCGGCTLLSALLARYWLELLLHVLFATDTCRVATLLFLLLSTMAIRRLKAFCEIPVRLFRGSLLIPTGSSMPRYLPLCPIISPFKPRYPSLFMVIQSS